MKKTLKLKPKFCEQGYTTTSNINPDYIAVLKKDKKDELAFYVKKNGRMEKACTVSAHYVMVTGMIERNGEAFLEISSWGKKYYVNWNEYEDMIQTHFLGNILGNILYIRQKRK